MNSLPTVLLGAALVAGAAFNGYETVRLSQTRIEIATERHALASLEAGRRDAQRALTAARQELKQSEDLAAAAQARAAAAAKSPAARLQATIAALKQLLEEAPEEKIPELRLLEPKDWIDDAQKFLSDRPGLFDATSEASSLFSVMRSLLNPVSPSDPIYATLSQLRRTARTKFAGSVHEALRRFLEISSAALPTDIVQLAPYLSSPADLEMLQRYKMLHGGKAGAADDKIIIEQSSALETKDGLLTLTRSSAYWKPTVPTEATAAGEAMGAAMEKAVAPVDEIFIRTFGDQDTLKRTMREGIEKFTAANSGRMPADLFELRPYLSKFDDDAYAEGFRPLVALLAYSAFHDGKFPDDPAAARPYSNDYVDLEKALRFMKLGADGHSLDFKVTSDD